MNMLVCVSRTPETTAPVKFSADMSEYDGSGVNFIMNPYDEWYALVRALEVKESQGGKVTLFHVGGAESDAVIRKGLAIGADDAVRVDAAPSSSMFVAKQIAEYCKANAIDILFFGKETIDFNGAEVGAMAAEMLDMPYISFAIDMQLDGNNATITREIEGGKEVGEVQTPFALSAAKGLAEQRIANMRGIMMSKRKPINVIPAADAADKATVVKYAYPDAGGDVVYIEPDNMDELVRRLAEEAKVL